MEHQMNVKGKAEYADVAILAKTAKAKQPEWKFINLHYLNQVSPGNHTFFGQMLKIFKEESISFLHDIHHQLTHSDFAGVAKTAHAMKPTGAYIGLDSLTVLMASLEKVARVGDDSAVRKMLAKIVPLVKGVNNEIDQYLYAA